MRIIAGQLKGQTFDSPQTHRTHPMSDKIRGAIFNALGDISDLTVLDAFAGSGALAIEALSRGASRALAVESDRLAQKAITENIQSLKLEKRLRLIKTPASAWLKTTQEAFDLVLLDPPYRDPQFSLLERLVARTKIGGVMVLSLPSTTSFTLSTGNYKLLISKTYGNATLAFYRRIS